MTLQQTRALYKSLRTCQLIELQAAFEARSVKDVTKSGRIFTRTRLALIADVLRARAAAARKADA
jgi:hypothetical protein